MKRVFAVILACLIVGGAFAQDGSDEAPAATTPAAGQPAGAGDATVVSVDATGPIDAMVDKAVAAYNAGDWKTFYADFTSTMAGIATEQAFDGLYKGMYGNQYGKVVKRGEPVKERCSIPTDAPVGLVVYKAEFEKVKEGFIAVNISKDGDVWKLMQVQFSQQ